MSEIQIPLLINQALEIRLAVRWFLPPNETWNSHGMTDLLSLESKIGIAHAPPMRNSHASIWGTQEVMQICHKYYLGY